MIPLVDLIEGVNSHGQLKKNLTEERRTDLRFNIKSVSHENYSHPCPNTVKTALSGHRIKRTVAEIPKFIFLIYCKRNLIKRTPFLCGYENLKSS